jgi:hypothetical protein
MVLFDGVAQSLLDKQECLDGIAVDKLNHFLQCHFSRVLIKWRHATNLTRTI